MTGGETRRGNAGWTQLDAASSGAPPACLQGAAGLGRLRAVPSCVQGVAAAAPESDPPPQLPWIIQCRGYALQVRQEFRLHSPSSGRTYNVGGRTGRFWIRASGTGHGYVVTNVDLSTTALYNPLTGDRMALPAAPYPPWNNGIVHVMDDDMGSPCLVVNTCLKTRHFGYCRPGQPKWDMIDGRTGMRHHAYRGGRFFVNNAAGDTLVIDASTRAVEFVMPPPPPPLAGRRGYACRRGDYLVESSGKMLRAVQVPRDGYIASSPMDYCFNIYQLDVRQGTPSWTKAESIGDRVLFFDEHGHGLSFEPNKSAGLRRNSIYFVHERRTWINAGEHRYLCRYSMDNGAVDRVVSLPDTFGDTWIVPSLRTSE